MNLIYGVVSESAQNEDPLKVQLNPKQSSKVLTTDDNFPLMQPLWDKIGH